MIDNKETQAPPSGDKPSANTDTGNSNLPTLPVGGWISVQSTPKITKKIIGAKVMS